MDVYVETCVTVVFAETENTLLRSTRHAQGLLGTQGLRCSDHRQVTLHRHILGDRVPRSQCIAPCRLAEMASYLHHPFINAIGCLAAENVNVDATDKADPVSEPLDPGAKGRDHVFVGVFGVDAGVGSCRP